MKRFPLIATAFLLLLALVGCNSHSGTNESTETMQEKTTGELQGSYYYFLKFKSLEELVESQKAVKEGTADDGLAEQAEIVNFLELEKLYLPAAIPEGYHLYNITVNKYLVSYDYMLESDMGSPDAIRDAYYKQQAFSFLFRRPGMAITIDEDLRHHNATKEDLIDGKYFFFGSSSLNWELDEVFIEMDMPLPLLEKQPDEQRRIAEMMKYTEVEVVELG